MKRLGGERPKERGLIVKCQYIRVNLFYLLLFLSLAYSSHRIIAYAEYPKDLIGDDCSPKKAIVIGATSGMGRQVARLLAQKGYEVGVVGRRTKFLHTLKAEFPNMHIKKIDVSQPWVAHDRIKNLIKEMGGLDLMVISVSCLGDVGCTTRTMNRRWEDVLKFINVDARGFWIAARVAMEHFEKQKYGHLVGVSSIDSKIGSAYGPEYSGAKAFIARFLDGTRNRMFKEKLPIYVTEIIPGPVNVERQNYDDIPGMYWVASKEEAAKQIYAAIERKVERAYITKRWKIMSWIFALAPDWLYRCIE